MDDITQKRRNTKKFIERIVHHLFAFLILLSALFWPGILSYERQQNWYVPIVQPDGIVDGGQILCLMTQTLIVLTIAFLEIYVTHTPVMHTVSVAHII
jgi:polyferredoxin